MRINTLVILCGLLCACCSSDSLPETGMAADTEKAPAAVPAARSERANIQLEREMQAIIAGNPVQDAEQALTAGDKRLWAYHNRVLVVPGLDASQQQQNGAMPVRIAPGLGDVIYSKKHLQLRQSLLEYMQQYNRRMLQAH